jgi:hypothetical protein
MALLGFEVTGLIGFYVQVEWLKKKVEKVPVRLVFESALELMSETCVGSFQMATASKAAGPPPAVKKLLQLFGSGREEDKLAGYLGFLKIGPKILKFVPMQKAQDLRAWCVPSSVAPQASGRSMYVFVFTMLQMQGRSLDPSREMRTIGHAARHCSYSLVLATSSYDRAPANHTWQVHKRLCFLDT